MYSPQDIEKKWQDFWEKNATFHTKNPQTPEEFKSPKFYALDMFPYPSGVGLHVGHPKGYTATDILSRYQHALGKRVLHPMGWDAFGLPAENYAIKTGTHPKITTEANINTFRRQIKALGIAYDWDREVDTTDPKYYKFTQWIFLQMFKKGLAYEQDLPINFCPSCKTGLANEEVLSDNTCERCGAKVEQKKLRQWVLAITKYADRLISDLDRLDWPEGLKDMQRNWIGKSEGCEFALKKADDENLEIRVYTTRIDTVFGMTYAVIAPDHADTPLFITANQKEACEAYIEGAKGKSNLERTELTKEKTGVFSGSYLINPFNEEKVPLYIADYVLGSYGTGAVMAVPAHDERDAEFAKKYNLPIKQSIAPLENSKTDPVVVGKPTIKRKNIIALVKHWEKDQYYVLDWENFGWKSFVIGGVEENESYEDAAIRETKEETGYQNIASVERIGFEGHASFFAKHKDENRYSIEQAYLITLADGTFVEPNAEEVKNHTGKWCDKNEVGAFISLANNTFFWDALCNGQGAFCDDGILIDSGEYTGLTSEEAREKLAQIAEEKGIGDKKINYKLRDWLFSRQRYWGEPIPLIHLEREIVDALEVKNAPQNSAGLAYKVGDELFVDEKSIGKIYEGVSSYIICDEQLPLLLPDVDNYEPSGTGDSPLANVDAWKNVELAPNLSGTRETNTMPQWGGSCWYYLRFMDPHNEDMLVSPEMANYWGEVDSYIGGTEHAVLHLLYARFWHKFLFDIGVLPTNEPFARLRNQGLILSTDGAKMSKSKGNTINPDDVVQEHGADTLRLYEMAMADFKDPAPWNTQAIMGVRRFLDKVHATYEGRPQKSDMSDDQIITLLNKTIVKVQGDIENCKYNTAISALMILLNAGLPKDSALEKQYKESFLILLHPFAPHIAEELWQMLGYTTSIYFAPWPVYDPAKLIDDEVTIAIQVNGKLRATIVAANNITKEEIETQALALKEVTKWIDGHEIVKTVFVPNKLLSIVIK